MRGSIFVSLLWFLLYILYEHSQHCPWQLRTLKPQWSWEEGNTSLIETSPLSGPAGLLMKAGRVNWSRTHMSSLRSLSPFTAPFHPASPRLVKKGGTVAFVWLTCLTKVTAAHGCMWMSGPAPLPLCTSVRAGAGRAGWKETNWTQKEGHSPSPDPLLALRPSISFRCSAGPSSACWLIPFSLPL